MNLTHDSQKAPITPSPSQRDLRRAKHTLGATSEYISRVLTAGAFTMWGALNLIVSLRTYLSRPAVPTGFKDQVARTLPDHWWITGIFIVLTGLIPFVCGLHLFRKLYLWTQDRL